MRAICAVLLLAAGAAQAATTGLQARDINGDGTVDAYYDPAANLTWSADANLPGTLGVSDWPGTDGAMTFSSAISFAKSLDLYGVTGWRLPRVYGAHCEASDLNCTFTSLEAPGNGPWRNIRSGFYWSESHDDNWLVCIMGGECTDQASAPGGVWAVRDGDIPGGPVALPSSAPPPVPEPASFVLLLLGLPALIAARRLSATS